MLAPATRNGHPFDLAEEGNGVIPEDRDEALLAHQGFVFDLKIDYMALVSTGIDKDPVLGSFVGVPEYTVPGVQYEGDSSAAYSNQVLREVKVGRRRIVQGMVRYERAVDPAGNVTVCHTSTCRPDRDMPNGVDKSGTFNTVLADKGAKGWIFLSLHPTMRNPLSPYTGQKYVAWALFVAKLRRQRHNAEQGEETEKKRAEFLRQSEEAALIQGNAIAGAIDRAVNGGRKGKKAEVGE